MHGDRSSDGAFSQWAAAAGDRDLLARFVRHADERAFAEIVRRHGALVLGVCRRVLRDRHTAEDAFQATFLVLARSARRIRRARSLASWLHSVAYRIARRSLAESHRRREQAVPMETVTGNDELADVGALYEQQLLDEELQELPEKYREPLVLHHLQGLSQQEVADRLGMSVSAVDGRLKRGRKQLKLRLLRRGVEFGAVLTAVSLGQSAVQAASIEPLVALTTQAAAAAHAGSATPSTVSPQAAQLAGKELTLMTGSTKLVGTLAASAAVVALIGLGEWSAGAVPGSSQRTALPLLSTVADNVTMERTRGDTLLAQADDVQPVAAADEPDRAPFQDEVDRLSRELADLAASVRANSAEVNNQRVDLQKSIDSLTHQLAALQDQVVSLSEESERREDSIRDEQESRLPVREPALDYTSSDPTERRIEEALQAETTFEFPANPLRDVAEYIGDLHNIPILLDEQALFDEGISPDEEVSLVISGVRLRSALDLLLKNVAGVPLDYVVQNEVLTITTRDKAERILDTRVYNLRHLSGSYAPEEVARIVRSAIRPWTWRSDGELMESPGVSYIPDLHVDERFQASVEALPDALVVTQSQRIHREIVELLQQLHRHDPESTTSAIITAAVNERLDEPVEVAFSDVPWRTIVSAVAQDHGLNVVFNEAAIADAGLTGNEDVTIAVTDVTLRSVFKLVLEQVGLVFVVEDEVIKVTSGAP